jgi:hypothetical protein
LTVEGVRDDDCIQMGGRVFEEIEGESDCTRIVL